LIRTTLAAAGLMLALASPALAQVEARASYVLTLGGINIALMDVDLKDDGRRYGLDLSANVTGLGSVLASGTAKASASGTSNGDTLTSDKFSLETRANGETFTVNVGYANRNVSSFQVEPPVLDTWDRVAIERSHLSGVSDFISAFVVKGGALDSNLCQRRAAIFTGVERFNIQMSYLDVAEATSPRTGYQGPLVACAVKYQPVSGHFETSDLTNYLADTSRIIVWYAPLGQSGYYVPYRVMLGTSMGDLSMVLVGMRS
jgi:hypothetical protein